MSSINSNFNDLEKELTEWKNNRILLVGPFKNRRNDNSGAYARQLKSFTSDPEDPLFTEELIITGEGIFVLSFGFQ